MKLMNVNHISILPYLTCNFECSYCVAHLPHLYRDKNKYGLWQTHYLDTLSFINQLDTKMILVSGGEPLLWNRWEEIIKKTNHYWYFVTNASYVPSWLNNREVKQKVKLFLAAFHRTGISTDKYIANVRYLQDMGYPVFGKIMYVKNDMQLGEAGQIINCGIPISFVPLVGEHYEVEEINKVRPYCYSSMYYNRFFLDKKEPAPCIAGTEETFQIDGLTMTRCGHYSSISLNNVPRVMRKLHNGYIGDIYKPQYYEEPKICNKQYCFCENHNFGGILDDSENPIWQKFIETGKWDAG